MRPRRRTLAALLPALTACALGAGCGGGAEADNAYVQEVASAQQIYVTRFDQVLRRLTPTSTLAQDREVVAAFGQATGRFVTALRAIEPPERVRDEHGRLVAAIVGYERRLMRAGRRLADGTTADRARARTDLSSGVADTQADITAAVGAINRRLD